MKLFYIFFFLLSACYVEAQELKPVSSDVSFKIKNFGMNVNGSLSGLTGAIKFDAEFLSSSTFEVSIPVNTIKTGVDRRDNHLKQDDYFDVEKYPNIHFVSTKVTASTNDDFLYVFGKLTIKDVTKEISFPFKVEEVGDGIHTFKGSFTVNRRDYNVGGSSISLGDEATISIEVTAKP